MQFEAKIGKFYVKIAAKLFQFKLLKIRAKRAKICNSYVKYDAKVENGGIGCGLNKKGGHLV